MRVRNPNIFPELLRCSHRVRALSDLATQRTARYHTLRRPYSSTPPAAPGFGFAFDIDGVLLRAAKPIEGASKALSYLQHHYVPSVLLTNGGGKHESDRVTELNSKLCLAVPLTPSQIIQSHTPFIHHVDSLKHKTILVSGGDHDNCRRVAQTYGFGSVITPSDIFHAFPAIAPFCKNYESYHASHARPLPTNAAGQTQISAIYIYNDPRDWGMDIQIILDLLLSEQGILGTYSAKNNDRSLPNNGYLQDGQPPLFFSNGDLLWAAEYHLNRLGQGGFREALDGVWNGVTGGPREGAVLHKTVIGKPFQETYEFAEKRLVDNLKKIVGRKDTDGLKRVYMIGDNPESDIRGANIFNSPRGIEWISLLTRTGVYQDRPGRTPSWQPRAIVDDVWEAVRWGLRHSGWTGDINRHTP